MIFIGKSYVQKIPKYIFCLLSNSWFCSTYFKRWCLIFNYLMQDDDQEITGDSIGEVTKQEYPVVKNTYDIPAVSNRKSKKKKKKSKDGSASTKFKVDESIDSVLADLSINSKPSSQATEFENIKARNNEVQPGTKKHGVASVLLVDPKHLKAENELRKIFGSKVVNSFENNHSAGSSRQMHGVRRVVHNPRRMILVSAPNYWPRWDGSMSMELLETKDEVHYFR